MRSLYTRIVVTVFLILLLSGAIALLISNVAYYTWWQPSYSEKTEQMASSARGYFDNHTDQDETAFYSFLARSGYQLFVIKPDDRVMRYGGMFRDETIDDDTIDAVRSGIVYEGMRDYPFHLFLLGLFDNEVINTYGFNVTGAEGDDAVFLRPDLSEQIRELHLFVGLFFTVLTASAFILIALATTLLVRPLKILTAATKSVASGERPSSLPLNRKDEIGTLARRFDHMVDSLEKSEGERRRFVSNVSHEFQSPLTSLTGYASILADQSEGAAKEYATIIRDETERLSGLTKQLLMLARLDEANVSLQTEVMISRSIDDVIRMYAFELDRKGVAVTTDLDESLSVKGDPVLLSQVWSNLLSNAIHASQEGGMITIRAYQDSRPIVSIQDEGIGMNEETQSRLFERFYKADLSRTSRGTGLGLAIANDIVRLHGGDLRVTSELGRGSVFIVRF